MSDSTGAGDGTPDAPWVLTTPSGGSEFEAYRDETVDQPALVVQSGKTQLRYALRGIDDLHQMLKERGDWMPLGSADEQKSAPEGSVEAWARSDSNPVGLKQRPLTALELGQPPLHGGDDILDPRQRPRALDPGRDVVDHPDLRSKGRP
jgi:hypothetical protein